MPQVGSSGTPGTQRPAPSQATVMRPPEPPTGTYPRVVRPSRPPSASPPAPAPGGPSPGTASGCVAAASGAGAGPTVGPSSGGAEHGVTWNARPRPPVDTIHPDGSVVPAPDANAPAVSNWPAGRAMRAELAAEREEFDRRFTPGYGRARPSNAGDYRRARTDHTHSSQSESVTWAQTYDEPRSESWIERARQESAQHDSRSRQSRGNDRERSDRRHSQGSGGSSGSAPWRRDPPPRPGGAGSRPGAWSSGKR